jgi:hypothetical protein
VRSPPLALPVLTDEAFPSYGHSLVQFDPKAEARLRWKIDLYIVPTVALLYLFCFIDRANIVSKPPPTECMSYRLFNRLAEISTSCLTYTDLP